MELNPLTSREALCILAVLLGIALAIFIPDRPMGTPAIGAGPDEKGVSAPQQQQAALEEIPPHPHPDEVSDGQWMFWAAIAAGAFACIAAGIKIYPAIRKRRRKG